MFFIIFRLRTFSTLNLTTGEANKSQKSLEIDAVVVQGYKRVTVNVMIVGSVPTWGMKYLIFYEEQRNK